MKTKICFLVISILIAGSNVANAAADKQMGEQQTDKQNDNPDTVITVNAFDTSDNGTGTIDKDDNVTITTKNKVYKGKADFSMLSLFKPTIKNDPAIKYKRGTDNGTVKLISGTHTMNCEFNFDEVIAMGYCIDSAGKEFDLFAK